MVGKIERLGINNLMGTPSGLSLPVGMYSRPSLTSPMAQLTCLLPSHSTENISNIDKINKEQHQKPPALNPMPPPGISIGFCTFI